MIVNYVLFCFYESVYCSLQGSFCLFLYHFHATPNHTMSLSLDMSNLRSLSLASTCVHPWVFVVSMLLIVLFMIMIDKMKNIIMPSCRYNSKTNIKIPQRGKIDINNTLVHDILYVVFVVEMNLCRFLKFFVYVYIIFWDVVIKSIT